MTIVSYHSNERNMVATIKQVKRVSLNFDYMDIHNVWTHIPIGKDNQ